MTGPNLRQRAMRNLLGLQDNSYPGRILVVGRTPTGKHVALVSGITGRSVGSRNRVYELGEEPGAVRTAVADPSRQAGDPELTIYNTIRESSDVHVVSNGRQTDSVVGLAEPDGLLRALRGWSYEPDSNHTARITGLAVVNRNEQSAQIAVHTKSPYDSSCEQHLFVYPNLSPGVGYFVHTYMGDDDPLPTFRGEPFPVAIANSIEDIAREFRGALAGGNFVSVAVKVVEVETGQSTIKIINQYEKVS